MTDQNFTEDNGNQGTSSFVADNSSDNNEFDVKKEVSNLQQQVDGMQKRMTDKDDFIGKLQEENQKLRENLADTSTKLDSMGSVGEALQRIKDAEQSNQDTTLDEDKLMSDLLEKFETVQQTKSEEQKQQANYNSVVDTLSKKFGTDKVNDIINKAATDNRLSVEDMKSLAKKSPDAVYRMVGVKDTVSFTPSHNQNVSYQEGEKNKEQVLAEFAKLRRENPKEYYKPETQRLFRQACLSD